jgi:hypothetical protein
MMPSFVEANMPITIQFVTMQQNQTGVNISMNKQKPDYHMANEKGAKRQIMIDKRWHRKLKIGEHETH